MLTVAIALFLQVSAADGGLEISEIDDVVALHAGELASCRNEKASGTVQLEFNVVDGGVPLALVTRDSRPGAASCFTKALYAWQFPKRPLTSVRYEWTPAKKRRPDEPVAMTAPVEVLRRNRGVIATCYLWHRDEASDTGGVNVDVVVGRSGAVLEARLRSIGEAFAKTELGDCVVAAVTQWRFPQMKSAARFKLAWYLVPNRPATPPDPDAFVVTALEPTAPTTGNIPFHVAALEQTHLLAGCPSDGEVLVKMEFTREADGGLRVRPKGSNPPAPALEDCVTRRASSFEVPLDAGEGHEEAWLFPGDGGVLASQIAEGRRGLPKAAIQAVIEQHKAEVKLCYEQQLQKVPSLSGKLMTKFVIGPTGDVLRATPVDMPSDLGPVSDCVVKQILGWKFPAPRDGGKVTVSFPWLLRPAK